MIKKRDGHIDYLFFFDLTLNIMNDGLSLLYLNSLF